MHCACAPPAFRCLNCCWSLIQHTRGRGGGPSSANCAPAPIVHAGTCALYRQLLRHCAAQRAALGASADSAACDPRLAHLNILITIAGAYFGQVGCHSHSSVRRWVAVTGHPVCFHVCLTCPRCCTPEALWFTSCLPACLTICLTACRSCPPATFSLPCARHHRMKSWRPCGMMRRSEQH